MNRVMRAISHRQSRHCYQASLGVLLALAVVFGSVTAGHAGVTTVSEYRTKGSYLLNFVRLVEWRPPRPIAGVLPVCVFGESPIGPVLDELAAAPINGRQVIVQRLTDMRKAGACRPLLGVQGAHRAAAREARSSRDCRLQQRTPARC